MKVREVRANNRKKVFEIETDRGTHHFPYALLRVSPDAENRVSEVFADEELGREGPPRAVQRLASRERGSESGRPGACAHGKVQERLRHPVISQTAPVGSTFMALHCGSGLREDQAGEEHGQHLLLFGGAGHSPQLVSMPLPVRLLDGQVRAHMPKHRSQRTIEVQDRRFHPIAGGCASGLRELGCGEHGPSLFSGVPWPTTQGCRRTLTSSTRHRPRTGVGGSSVGFSFPSTRVRSSCRRWKNLPAGAPSTTACPNTTARPRTSAFPPSQLRCVIPPTPTARGWKARYFPRG